MASFASVATLPSPSCSSSDDDYNDAKPLPPLPASKEIRPPPQHQHQHQQQPQRRQLERDCNVAMKAARAGDVDQVLARFAELRASGTPSVLCYNTLMNALVEAGHVKDAHDAFGEMLAAGVAPNASSCNILLKLHSWISDDDDDSPYKAILWMREAGVEPDVGTYSTLITGLCRAGRLPEAWGVLECMLEQGCRPMVHTYTPIVQGYCREGRVGEAMDLMATMEAADCPPNVVTYNVLIRALCDAAKFKEVKQILKESRTKDWTPSIVTYNTFMNGLCQKGKAKEALVLLGVMLGKGLDPTDFTLSILLNCLCHASRISHARFLLERSTSSRWYAGVVAYDTVMGRLCKMGHWRGVLKLLTDMIKKGVMPNTRTFNIVIRSLCIGRKCSAAKSLVCNQGFAANVVTYNTLIDWFFYHRKRSEVGHLMCDMAAGNIAVDEVTYTIFVVGLCRDGNFAKASSCFLESLENGLSMDLLGVLINRLAYNGKIPETIRIFQNMRERKGLFLDNSIFDLTIERFCRAGYCHDKYIHNLNSILDAMLGKQ
ncbi:hypothetical protein CFC21_007668 [Triticum aestivum]|uniref:Pentatricopeptide repeat-containing protein n=3 Tax=Triticum TaxID=4564 RepID=A0A9R0QYN0_TRITD|nr:pentatricopeptide repeat-containing protein At5g65560-like [Triticum aestivum]KAF6990481.1 hypothetical protein CFC21_007668 [Triticum aestivum]VAH19907.1 unnamed protein product [Triticum turgidum subsp. durum]